MPEPSTYVDVPALHAALEHERRSRELSWRRVAHEAGVSPSTLTRLAQHGRPDLDSFAALVHWLGMPAERFMRHPGTAAPESDASETMAMVSAYLRANRSLSPQSAAALEDVVEAAAKFVEAALEKLTSSHETGIEGR